MRIPSRRAVLVTLTTVLAACTGQGTVSPDRILSPKVVANLAAITLPSVRISEFHYDNSGTDIGEAIEVSGPAGTDLTGYSLVLYNGTGGAVYDTDALTGTIPASCGPRGVVVLSYPSNGIQNGSPDGIALVGPGGVLIEFLSYEGTFAGVGGAANGTAATDVGVSQDGTQAGTSIKRSGDGLWTVGSPSGFGTCNDDDEPPPAAVVAKVTVTPASASVLQGGTQQFTAQAFDALDQPIAGVTFSWSSGAPAIAGVSSAGLATGLLPGETQIIAVAPNLVSGSAALQVDPPAPPSLPPTRFSELHYDNFGTDAGESIEIEGPAGTSLVGWSVVLYNGSNNLSYNTRTLSGTIPATCGGRGVVVLTYPQDGIQNGSPDGMALIAPGGVVVEFLSYEGTMTAADGPAAGVLATDLGVSQASAAVGQSLRRSAAGVWTAGAASFGACNDGGIGPPPGNTISFSGRTASDPALPVGFQDQIFATVRDPLGAVVVTGITWSSDTPLLMSIEQNGVMTALAAGQAVLRATTADGNTSATVALPTRVGLASLTALYEGNAEFGEPADGDPADDFILRHTQFTASYNRNLGTPNWVSYNLEATHFGAEDRCDCFTFDPALPAAFTRYTTADYTGAGAFHGYGIDRGHLARSFDRTSASLDNAFTFYFSNIIPQAADLNQGPWAAMESFVGDLARLSNKEVYIVTGPAGSKGTIKNEGKINIPASTWKVAVILPRNQGLEDIDDYQDPQVIAVIMPNDPGVRLVNWETYKTTVDAIESLTGYDLLALLPDQIEILVESGTKPPIAMLDGPYFSFEGAAVAMSGAGSSDPDGGALSYQWSFGDGASGTGALTSHVYTQDGSYTVSLKVTDVLGVSHTTTSQVTVSNVPPAIGALSGATLLPGETYAATGAFSDPGADQWSATVDYGEGAGAVPLALAGKSFSLAHTYAAAGTFTVVVRVSDDHTTSSRSATVTVLTPTQAAEGGISLIAQMVAAGALAGGNGNSLTVKLEAAISALERGHRIPSQNQLEALLNALSALVRSGRLGDADAAPLRNLILRLISAVS